MAVSGSARVWMTRFIISTFLWVVLLFGLLASSADGSIIYNVSGIDFSDDGPGSSGATIVDPFKLVITISNIASDKVRIEIDPDGLDPTKHAKISDVWLNVDSAITSLTFSHVSGVMTSTTPSYLQDGFQVDGSGRYDVHFKYSTSGANGTLFPGSGSSVYEVMGSGLTKDSFFFKSIGGSDPPGNFYSAIHMNTTGNGNSGHYAGSPADPSGGSGAIPEPSSVAIWSLVGLGLAGVARRRMTRKQRE